MDAPLSLNGDSVDPMDINNDCKSHVKFSITDAIKKSRNLDKASSDNNNNYNKSEGCNQTSDEDSPVNEFAAADQNNNDSEVKKHLADNIYRGSNKSRSHQMQQLLQQHVFTPHQLQQLIVPPMTMSSPKDSLFHFEQKRKQMEILMHQIQEQLHANILQQTHLLQNQPPSGEGGSGKKGSTFQLQQKLAVQQQELAQQFQLVQRQYLLHQSGMQLLFPHHHQQQQQLQSKSTYFNLILQSFTFLDMISLLTKDLFVIALSAQLTETLFKTSINFPSSFFSPNRPLSIKCARFSLQK